MHPGRHPAGAALQRRPLATQLGLALAERELPLQRGVAAPADAFLIALPPGEPLPRVQLEQAERLRRQQRRLDVRDRGVGHVDERQDPLLEDRAPAETVLTDHLLLLQRQRERLERRAAGGAVRLLRGLQVGEQVALGRGGRGELVAGRGPVSAVGRHRGVAQPQVGAQQPQPQGRVAAQGDAVGVELGEPPGRRPPALVQPSDRLEQLELLLLGPHGGVRRLEVVEVLDGAIRRGVRRGPLEHHLLVELIDAAHLVAGLDPGQQPQRLRAVAVGTDAQACVQDGGVVGVGAVDADAGEELLERVRVEPLGHRCLERLEGDRALVGGQLHLHVARAGRAPGDVVGAERGEAAAPVVDERHRDRAPRVGTLAPQELLDRAARARVVDHVDRTPQVGEEVALADAAGAARDGVVGGAVELRVRGHHQRGVGVEDRALADPGGAGDDRGLAAQRDRRQATEAAPVDQLHQRRAPLHGVVGGGGDLLSFEEPLGGDRLDLVNGHRRCSLPGSLRGRLRGRLRTRSPRRRGRRGPRAARRRCWPAAAPRAAPGAARAGAAARRPR